MPKQPDDQSAVPDENAAVPEDVVTTGDEDVAGESYEGDECDVAAAVDADSTEQRETDIEEDADTVRAELDECRDRALRLQAELENYRKRAQRTLDEERRYACLPLMRDLLTVVDNLQRAIDAARQNAGSTGLLEGVEMVAEQLAGILKQHHCEEIPAEGTRFDPHLHEAIAQLPTEDFEPGHVSQVTQAGYQLHGRVVRPSQVIVAAEKPDEQSE